MFRVGVADTVFLYWTLSGVAGEFLTLDKNLDWEYNPLLLIFGVSSKFAGFKAKNIFKISGLPLSEIHQHGELMDCGEADRRR